MSKVHVAAKLARSLAHFYPTQMGQFLCPTCLGLVSIAQPHLITEAHIVPEAAGGMLFTYLCKDCNNGFGSAQDKWLGEYLKATRGENPFEQTKQAGYFTINGMRVGGKFIARKDGLQLIADAKNTNPRVVDELRLLKGSGRINVGIPVPLMKNRALVDPGFLTAAYLLWFRNLGYSWALQDHLDGVRAQIRNPQEKVLKGYCFEVEGRVYRDATMALGYVGDKIVLAMLLSDKVVILPSRSDQGIFASMNEAGPEKVERVLCLTNHFEQNVSPPCGLIFEDKIVVAPDVLLSSKVPGRFIRMTGDGAPPVEMTAVTDEEYNELKARPEATNIDLTCYRPTKLTGSQDKQGN